MGDGSAFATGDAAAGEAPGVAAVADSAREAVTNVATATVFSVSFINWFGNMINYSVRLSHGANDNKKCHDNE